jgi:signal transduction histidine kinase
MARVVGAARRLTLLTRVGIAFALVSLVLSGLLAAVTWNLAAGYLLEQRELGATRQADVNVRLVGEALSETPGGGLDDLLTGLAGGADTTVALRRDGAWTTSGRRVDPTVLPDRLLEVAERDAGARQRLVVDGVPVLAVAMPLPEQGALYVELFGLTELDRTLRYLGAVLAAGVVASAALALLLGFWAGRRALQPLSELTAAAARVAGGDLTARLPSRADADLGPLAVTFNRTADALQQRVQRDARFAADVSHELRSPLTTLVNAVAVLRRRRDEMPAPARQAVELLDEEVHRFQRMVVELLEISRSDVLDRERLDVVDLVRGVLGGRAQAPPLDTDGSAPVVPGDRRRLEQVLGNLLDNAESHGDGAVRVGVAGRDGRARIEVDDAGPGIPAEFRGEVFERFARGTRSGRRGADGGTGLGLALVAEHVRRHGGSVWVEERPGGGTRAVVELIGEQQQ